MVWIFLFESQELPMCHIHNIKKVIEHCSIPNISIAQHSVRLTVLKQQLLKTKCLAFFQSRTAEWVSSQAKA